MKKTAKIILNVTLVATIIGLILECVTCYRNGTFVDFKPIAMIFAMLTCGYCAADEKTK